jgi:hypothetical protein
VPPQGDATDDESESSHSESTTVSNDDTNSPDPKVGKGEEAFLEGLKQGCMMVPMTVSGISYTVQIPLPLGSARFQTIQAQVYKHSAPAALADKTVNRIGNISKWSEIDWTSCPSDQAELATTMEKFTSYANGDRTKLRKLQLWKRAVIRQFDTNNDSYNKMNRIERDAHEEFKDSLMNLGVLQR